MLLYTGQDINILFHINFFQHSRTILQGVIAYSTMRTEFQVSSVLVRTVCASVPLFIANEALARSTSSYVSIPNESTSSSKPLSSIVIPMVISSVVGLFPILIVWIALLISLCYCVCLVDGLVVLSIFQVQLTVDRVVAFCLADGTPGSLSILHVVWAVRCRMVSTLLADVSKRVSLHKMDILSAVLLLTSIFLMTGHRTVCTPDLLILQGQLF